MYLKKAINIAMINILIGGFMKLPSTKPFEKNVVCETKEEFGELVKRTVERSGGGAFFKVLGKSSDGAYYATLLIDDEKILAVEVHDASEGTTLVGRPAMELFDEVLTSGPVIADAFPLSDIDVKTSIAENIEVYNATPKMHLSELCPAFGKDSSDLAVIEEMEHKRPPKPRTKFVLDVPGRMEPYFRALGNRLAKYAKTLGIDVSEIRINAKEVRYALGAGTGIHATVEVRGSSESPVPPGKLKQSLETFVYREAAGLSKELDEKVVISSFSLQL